MAIVHGPQEAVEAPSRPDEFEVGAVRKANMQVLLSALFTVYDGRSLFASWCRVIVTRRGLDPQVVESTRSRLQLELEMADEHH